MIEKTSKKVYDKVYGDWSFAYIIKLFKDKPDKPNKQNNYTYLRITKL